MEKKQKYSAIFCYVSVNSSKSIGKGSQEASLLLLLNPNALMERSQWNLYHFLKASRSKDLIKILNSILIKRINQNT